MMLLQNTSLKGGSGVLVGFSERVGGVEAAVSMSDSVVFGLVLS